MPTLRALLVLCLLASAGRGRAAEPTTLLCYRLVASQAPAGQEPSDPGLAPTAEPGQLLLNLLRRQEFAVDKLGEAPIRAGAYAVDTTAPVHFMLRNADGGYTLETSPKRSGFAISGTVGRRGDVYVVAVDCTFSVFHRQPPADAQARAAPDLDIGMPLMDTRHILATVHATPGMPACFGGGSDANGAKIISFYVLLK